MFTESTCVFVLYTQVLVKFVIMHSLSNNFCLLGFSSLSLKIEKQLHSLSLSARYTCTVLNVVNARSYVHVNTYGAGFETTPLFLSGRTRFPFLLSCLLSTWHIVQLYPNIVAHYSSVLIDNGRAI